MLLDSSPLSTAGARHSWAAARGFLVKRRAIWPLASGGLLYAVGPSLEPVKRFSDLLTGSALWPTVTIVALLALLVVAVDDRRLRRRLRRREERLQVVR